MLSVWWMYTWRRGTCWQRLWSQANDALGLGNSSCPLTPDTHNITFQYTHTPQLTTWTRPHHRYWLFFFFLGQRMNSCSALPLEVHTHTFNSPLAGTTRVSRYQKGKTGHLLFLVHGWPNFWSSIWAYICCLTETFSKHGTKRNLSQNSKSIIHFATGI